MCGRRRRTAIHLAVLIAVTFPTYGRGFILCRPPYCQCGLTTCCPCGDGGGGHAKPTPVRVLCVRDCKAKGEFAACVERGKIPDPWHPGKRFQKAGECKQLKRRWCKKAHSRTCPKSRLILGDVERLGDFSGTTPAPDHDLLVVEAYHNVVPWYFCSEVACSPRYTPDPSNSSEWDYGLIAGDATFTPVDIRYIRYFDEVFASRLLAFQIPASVPASEAILVTRSTRVGGWQDPSGKTHALQPYLSTYATVSIPETRAEIDRYADASVSRVTRISGEGGVHYEYVELGIAQAHAWLPFMSVDFGNARLVGDGFEAQAERGCAMIGGGVDLNGGPCGRSNPMPPQTAELADALPTRCFFDAANESGGCNVLFRVPVEAQGGNVVITEGDQPFDVPVTFPPAPQLRLQGTWRFDFEDDGSDSPLRTCSFTLYEPVRVGEGPTPELWIQPDGQPVVTAPQSIYGAGGCTEESRTATSTVVRNFAALCDAGFDSTGHLILRIHSGPPNVGADGVFYFPSPIELFDAEVSSDGRQIMGTWTRSTISHPQERSFVAHRQ